MSSSLLQRQLTPLSRHMHGSVGRSLNLPAAHPRQETAPGFSSVSVIEPPLQATQPAVPDTLLYCAGGQIVQVLLGLAMVPVYPGSHRQTPGKVSADAPGACSGNSYEQQSAALASEQRLRTYVRVGRAGCTWSGARVLLVLIHRAGGAGVIANNDGAAIARVAQAVGRIVGAC